MVPPGRRCGSVETCRNVPGVLLSRSQGGRRRGVASTAHAHGNCIVKGHQEGLRQQGDRGPQL